MKFRICALLLLAVAPLAAQAQEPGWSPPQHIQTKALSNWFPSMAIDPWGGVHLVWSNNGTAEETTDALMYAAKQGDRWTPSNDVINTGGSGIAVRNALAVDRSGRLHAVVRSRDYVYYTWAASQDAWSAQRWSEPHVINGLGKPYYVEIAVDAQDVLHVAWQESTAAENADGCESCSSIWYRRSVDHGTTWSTPITLSTEMHGTLRPTITVAGENGLYVTWDEITGLGSSIGQPSAVGFAYSPDGGETWSPPQSMTIEGDIPQLATLAVDGAQNALLIFCTTTSNQVLFRLTSDHGTTWTDPAPIGGLAARSYTEGQLDKYSAATDSAGNVHLLAVGRREGSIAPALYHVVWNSASRSWGPPAIVSANDLYPEWPELVLARGNQLHATWFTRSREDQWTSEKSAYQVWYSALSIDAPRTEITVVPTPTPLPTPTELPRVAAAQPVAKPSLPPESLTAPPPESLRSEIPLMRYVGMAIAPAGILALVVLALVLCRRLL